MKDNRAKSIQDKVKLLLTFFIFFTSVTAWAQPGNNTCTNATTLTVAGSNSAVSGDLYLADQTNPVGSCGNQYDVWYKFTVPATATFVTINVSLPSGSWSINTGNTFIELFNASTCGTGLNNRSIGGCNDISVPRRYTGLTAGNTYYFRIYTTAGNPNVNAGSWNFAVGVTSIVNNDCGNATSLTPGTTFAQQSIWGATASTGIPVVCATGNPDDDIWYSFSAVASTATVTLSGIGSAITSTGARLQVFSGACGSLSSLGCGTGIVTVSGLSSGFTYYVRVYSFGTGQAGYSATNSGFNISVTPSAATAVSSGRMKEIYSQTILSAPQVLNNPWEVTLGPDNNLWVTESKGYRLFRVNPVTGARDTVLDISQNSTFLPLADRTFNMQFNINTNNPQGGFAGLALHPKFLDAVTPQNFIYLAYVHTYVGGSAPSGIFYTNRVVRFTYNTGTGKLESPVSLCDTLPGSGDHNSQRMIIAPVAGTDYLFYASGDMGAGQFDNVGRPIKAQSLNSYEGKILRFNLLPDGDGGLNAWIPNSNPYNATLGVQSAVWATGIRNNQGFAYNSVLNILYGSSHGPYSDDEINVLQANKNYGHPVVIGYAADGNYNGVTAGAGAGTTCPVITNEVTNAAGIANYKDPLYSAYAAPNATISTIYSNPWAGNGNGDWPSEGWSGLDLYTNTVIPGWKNSLIAAGLKWGRLIRMKLNATGDAVVATGTTDTVTYIQSTNRYRDLAIAPNGKDIYIIMDKSSATSGPTTGSSLVPGCAGCIQKYTFLGYADATGKSSIPTTIDVTAGTANSCVAGTGVTIDNTNSNYWVPITGPDGNIMAEINANGQNLGNITSSFYTNTGAIRTRGSVRYLNRNITVTPQTQPGGAVKIRLYFSKAEYDALDADALSGVNAIGDVKILKNNDACGNAIATTTELITPTFSEAHGANGYMLQATITAFSSFYFASANVVLPLNLITFTGSFQNGATRLKWETENESNTDYFAVERSVGNGDYQSIGRVQAKGAFDAKASYNLTDAEAGTLGVTVIYYRLRIVDKDGKTSYSQVVVINIGDVVTSLSVYPNPAREEAILSISSDVEQQLSWQLVDNMGRVLVAKQAVVRKGNNAITIDIRTIPAGTYFIKVTGKTVQAIQKLQKQ